MLDDEVVVVAVHSVIGDAVVDDGRAALVLPCMWPLEDRRNFSGPSRRGMLSPPYRPFNLAAAKSTVWPRFVALLLLFTADSNDFWNIGRRGVFHHARPAVTHSG